MMQIRRFRHSDEIPTSSMADVAFLLVVYFMIMLTFTATKGLDMGLPEDPREVTVDPVESVLVEIQADGRLIVDQRPLALADLLGYLAPRLAQNPDKPVILKPDPKFPYGSMLEVYDELRMGPEKLGLDHEINVALPTEREITRFWS
jgi:biopolymer transport protein ExbD